MVYVKHTVSNDGVGFLGLLTVAFIVLKLLGLIGWSWWWVLAPLWFAPAVLVGIAAVFGTILLIGHFVQKELKRRRRASRAK